MSGSEPDEVVVTMNDDNASTSSNVAKKKTTLSAQAQSRMSVLSTACKKHEFVPFTKDGHTLFVKFDIDMEEKANTGSVAVFVIRLLIEGYWTLFVHGKKLLKSHPIYPKFSCENTRASSSKNYKLDIGKVDELFGYLNSCIFCVGHPEFYHLARAANRGDGLTIIPLSNDVEAVEVLRNVDWKGKNYPSTLVHKNCELIKTPKEPASEFSGPSTWFRCRPCSEISAVLLVKDSKTQEFENANANKLLRSDDENLPPPSTIDLSSQMPTAPSRRKSGSQETATPAAATVNGHHGASPNHLNVNSSSSTLASTTTNASPANITFDPPDPNGPSYLLARNEEGRYYVLRSSAGDVFCGLCAPNPFRFAQQQETVSYNEHLWMKHHVFIDSISIWCDICHKPFFDKGRFRVHWERDHHEMLVK